MISANQRHAKPFHFSRYGNTGFEFDPTATEVVIMDRTGRPIWKKTKTDPNVPIRWTGMDSLGQTVQTGDYICKIVYPDSKTAYLPFVFMRQG